MSKLESSPSLLWSCIFVSVSRWTFLFLLTLLVAFRSDPESSHGLPRVLRDYPWLECLTPLWVLDLFFAGVAVYVAANACAGRFVMTPTQGLCFALLISALVGSTLAEILLTGDQRWEGVGGSQEVICILASVTSRLVQKCCRILSYYRKWHLCAD